MWIPCSNYSTRSGPVTLLIVHTAEGARTWSDLGYFFQGTEGGANPTSSQVGIDDEAGVIGEYVKPEHASWCAGNVNGYADQVELCGFADWSRAEWLDNHPVMLDNLRAWLAEESARFGIPLVKSTTHGVCGHVDVSGPGGHYDPGPEFPWDVVLGGTTPTPTPEPEEQEMVIIRSPKGEVSMFDGTHKFGIVDTASMAAFTAAGIKTAEISQHQYDRTPNA